MRKTTVIVIIRRTKFEIDRNDTTHLTLERQFLLSRLGGSGSVQHFLIYVFIGSSTARALSVTDAHGSIVDQ